MKKLINSPDDVITGAPKGVDAADENIRVDHESRVIFYAEPTRAEKVAVVSGGGSGHEPLCGGLVGVGVLDAACASRVFTSPTPDWVLAATVGMDADAGMLYVVENYTGGVMNFEIVAKLAAGQGVHVETVVIADDVTVEDSLYTVGRRGVGLMVLLERITGAVAKEGHSLGAVVAMANKINEDGRSMSVALTSCTILAAGKPTSDLPENQMEIDISIHGKPDRHRELLTDTKDTACQLVEPILADHDLAGLETIVVVNGMDGAPLTELYLVYGEVEALLDAAGVRMARNLMDNYTASLDMTGCSVTVLKANDELLALWDTPVRTAGLRWGL